jgi:hypothetical protein
MIRIVQRVAGPALLVSSLALAALASLGCGSALDEEGVLPLVTIHECQELGGAPLFDPDDERPAQMSCPEGLETIAEFEEEFFGSHGGICCRSPEVERASPT